MKWPLTIPALALAMLGIMPAPATAQPFPGRPLTPAEGRALRDENQRLRGLNDRIERAAARYRTSARALRRAVGHMLGAVPGIGDAELIRQLEEAAGDAAEVELIFADQETRIAAMADAEQRRLAQAALGRARAAFDDGRFADARREMVAGRNASRLRMRGRQQQMEAARRDWMSWVQGEAGIAVLQADYEGAARIYLSAIEEEPGLPANDRFTLAIGAAHARFLRGSRVGDNAALESAIGILRLQALPVAPREQRPLEWAMAQNNLGNALLWLGQGQAGRMRLEEARVAIQSALQVLSPTVTPMDWANSQNDLGNVHFRLGERETGTTHLDAAREAYEAALRVWTLDNAPLDWAMTQNNLGNIYLELGDRRQDARQLGQAAAAYENALRVWTREQMPLDWARARHNLGSTYRALGVAESSTVRMEQAVATLEEVLRVRTRDLAPAEWARTQNSLGIALTTLGERDGGTTNLYRAIWAFDAAQQVWTRESAALDWAGAELNMAYAATVLAPRTGDWTVLEESRRQTLAARAIMEAGGHVPAVESADTILRRIAALQARIRQ